ncbi:unnamed protein product [Larinioides sclopetarius]|uniref:EF-hand domain-containing protein n=1 Tax=Larinioides sclopetarius TaxID=280406 RepID=A0AAV2AJQ3_9ARAC
MRVSDDLPIDEVELRIKEKIKPKLYDVIRAFWLFDINKDGLIQKTELRRIIRNYCFDLSDDLFEDLWKNYDPKFTGVIKYKDFLIRLGINADRYQMYMPSDTVAQSLCWSDKKAKETTDELSLEQRSRRAALENRDDPAIQGLPMKEIENVLIKRLQRRSKTLKSIFNLFDYENNGQISLSDFRGVINFFVMPMSTSLCNRVLKRLELNCSDPDYNIKYNDFLEKFCKPSSSAQKSCQRVSEKLDCYPVIQRIKNHVLNPDARLRSVFTKTTQKSNNMSSRNGGPKDESKYRDLQGNRLKNRLKHNLNKNILDVEKAILVCDPHQSGFILPEKLLNILNGLCIPLTEEQFKEATSEFRLYGDSLNYKEFLDAYKKLPGEDTKKWVSTIDKLATFKSRCPPELPVDEVEEILCECIQSRKTAMLKDFKALDVCSVGVACKDDARNILNKFSFRFNDKQFNELWKKFPVNKYDQLVYDQFLEQYAPSGALPKTKTVSKNPAGPNVSSKSKPTPKPPSPDRSSNVGSSAGASSSPPCEMHQKYKQCKANEENRKSTKEILYASAPHLRQIIDSIEPAIVRNFRTIRFHLRRADPKVTGYVDFNVLKNILAKSGINFSKEDEFHVLEYFDSHLTGKINYRDFLRIFVWYA